MHAHACASVHVEAVEGEDEVQGGADAPFASIRLPRTGPTALHLILAFGSLDMNACASMGVHDSTPPSPCLPASASNCLTLSDSVRPCLTLSDYV